MASTSRKPPPRRPARAAARAAALLPLCACIGGAPLLLSDPADLHESEVPSLTVQLGAGDHTVQCEPQGVTSSAGLHVVPARPGVEDSGAVQ